MEPRFDEKGLIPVVLQDYQTNRVTMVGYMDKEAWQKTLEEKKIYFFSRSRKKLWLKGKTSGNFQVVKAVYLDCDHDAALIQVKPEGPVCHSGNDSCFYTAIMASATPFAFQDFWGELFQIIRERKENPRKNSYTSQLLQQGKEKICQKLGEEMTELIISSFRGDKKAIVHEIADVIYHLLVLMNHLEIALGDVSGELSRRRK